MVHVTTSASKTHLMVGAMVSRRNVLLAIREDRQIRELAHSIGAQIAEQLEMYMQSAEGQETILGMGEC
jgi:hypothetical protein